MANYMWPLCEKWTSASISSEYLWHETSGSSWGAASRGWQWSFWNRKL